MGLFFYYHMQQLYKSCQLLSALHHDGKGFVGQQGVHTITTSAATHTQHKPIFKSCIFGVSYGTNTTTLSVWYNLPLLIVENMLVFL